MPEAAGKNIEQLLAAWWEPGTCWADAVLRIISLRSVGGMLRLPLFEGQPKPMAYQSERSPEKLGVMSPFEDAGVKAVPAKPKRQLPVQWIVAGASFAVAVVVLVVAGWLVWSRTVSNPYRTLEQFSVERYFENPQALVGNRFQATLRVEGDLGWSAGAGKLMVFSVEGDPRYIPVLLTGDNLSYDFRKGQTYMGQLRVGEKGLLYATDLRKK
jgi:hypothetical protein